MVLLFLISKIKIKILLRDLHLTLDTIRVQMLIKEKMVHTSSRLIRNSLYNIHQFMKMHYNFVKGNIQLSF